MSKRRNQPINEKWCAPAVKGLLLIGTLAAIAVAVQWIPLQANSEWKPSLSVVPHSTPPLQLAPGDTTVSDDFSTHLPLVIFDIGEEEAKLDNFWDTSKGYHVSVDYNPYEQGQIWVFDNPDQVNRLADEPAMTSAMQIKLRGNSSRSYPKKQYAIELLDERGNQVKHDLLGMGAESDWILNISWQDPALLRNYLGATFGTATSVTTLDARYCEVVRQRGDTYEYMGVYLLMETVKRDSNRVDIPKYRANQSQSFILRRDRYNETQYILNNYATQNGLTKEFLGVKYPKMANLHANDAQWIEERISSFEKALFSEDVDTFLTYRNYIEVESFIDYFLFNEMMMNYDAGIHSTYLFTDYTGKLKMGPFWDFDQGLANDPEYVSKLDSTAFHDAPWFRQLLRDPNFVRELVERYHELRAGALSDANLSLVIENSQQYLGSAAQRDWNRWQYEQVEAKNAHVVIPNSYGEAVESLCDTLFTHAHWLDENIDSLYQFSEPSIVQPKPEEVAKENADYYSNLLAVVFIGVFVISALLIRREL